MDPGYYRKYYNFERTHWWFTVRQKIISDIIVAHVNPKPASLILNVGVATGASTDWLKQFGQVVSLESDHEACRFLQDELKIEVIEGSVSALPFPDMHFDMICAFDVLEHVEEDQQAISEIYRVLKPGGSAVITVPAFRFLWSRHDLVNHHKRRYTKKELRQKLARCGFQQKYDSYFNSILFIPIAFYRLVGKLIARQDRSDFESSISGSHLFNGIFKAVFNFERKMLKHFRFPAGVSIVSVVVKP